MIKTVKDDVYSEKKMKNSTIDIIDYLRSNGHPFAQINTIEKLNEPDKTIDINYVISNGPSFILKELI